MGKRQAGISGNQSAMRDMKTRSGPRSSKPVNTAQPTRVRERVQDQMRRAGTKAIAAELRRNENRHKFSSRKDVAARARADYQAGKIKRGQLQKTIERRWKESQKRQQKFKASQTELKKTLTDKLNSKLKGDNPSLGIRPVTALIVWQISNDERELTLPFISTPETFWDDAQDALNGYTASENAHMLSATPLEWGGE